MLKAAQKLIILLVCHAFLIVTVSAQTNGAVSTQISGLPRLRNGESYTKVRSKMIRAGWKPFHAEDSDQCGKGDTRCAGRPEMHVCAGTGLGNCEFLWKRKGRTVSIFTVGEAGGRYSGFRIN